MFYDVCVFATSCFTCFGDVECRHSRALAPFWGQRVTLRTRSEQAGHTLGSARNGKKTMLTLESGDLRTSKRSCFASYVKLKRHHSRVLAPSRPTTHDRPTSKLECIGVYWNVLECIPIHSNTLQYTPVHSNTLQYTPIHSIHSNTLQYS